MPNLRETIQRESEQVGRERGEGGNVPDSSQPVPLAQRLTHNQVRILLNQRHRARLLLLSSKIDISFIYDDDAFESFVFEDLGDGREGDGCARWVAWRAEEDELDRWVFRNCFVDLQDRQEAKKGVGGSI